MADGEDFDPQDLAAAVEQVQTDMRFGLMEEPARIAAQQNTLTAAVDAGELSMEAGVAERAAARCETLVLDLEDWLADSPVLLERRRYGDNADGHAMAIAQVATAQAFVRRVEGFRDVVGRMAATYRQAGGLMEHTEQANAQSYRTETP